MVATERSHVLLPHPGGIQVPPDWRIGVDMAVTSQHLQLTYRFPRAGTRIAPSSSHPVRRNGLWQTTCAEVFVGLQQHSSYREFNFAPSGDWACYDFAAYRESSDACPAVEAPFVQAAACDDIAIVRVELPLASLPAAERESYRIGLSMVLEDHAGGLSYWALAHSPARADFHDAACFVATLPTP